MKRISAATALLGLFGVVSAIGITHAESIPTDYVASWRLENNVLDDTGVNNGTQIGGTFVAGKIGQAVLLNGVNQCVDFGNNPSLNFGTTASFSISTWIKRGITSAVEQDVIAKHSGQWQGWRVGLAIWGGTRTKVYFGVGNLTRAFYVFGPFIEDTNWHHVVAIIDRPTNRISIYTGNVAAAPVNVPASFDVNPPADSVNLGRRSPSPTGGRYFNGTIDQTRIYDRVLSAAEVQALYHETAAAGYTLAVQSIPVTGVNITGTYPGITNYQTTLDGGESVSLTAPYQSGSYFFLHWIGPDGIQRDPSTLVFTMPTRNTTVTAVYTVQPEFWVNDDTPWDGIPPGNNANPGTSRNAPMRDIQALLDRYPNIGTGHTVNVAGGRYNEAIYVRSSHSDLTLNGAGSSSTTIDGYDVGRCFTFDGVRNGTLSGFTIANGGAGAPDGIDGGGIAAVNSSLTIANNVIRDNYGEDGVSDIAAGGILGFNSDLTVLSNTITGNGGREVGGVGGHGILIGNTIAANFASTSSRAPGIGGVEWSTGTVSDNIISGNSGNNPTRPEMGGAVGGLWCGSATVTNNVITDNTAEDGVERGGHVGGVACGSATMVNNIIAGNRSISYGTGAAPAAGGLRCTGSATIANNTIADNASCDLGGGILCVSGSSSVKNCIVWGNSAAAGGPQMAVLQPAMLTVHYSDVQNGQDAILVQSGASLTYGIGNINADPLFDAGGDYHLKSQYGRWDPVSQTWVNDTVTSPCIDAGDPADDYSNEPEPNGSRINMGAYGNTAQASKSAPPPTHTLAVQSIPVTGIGITGTRPGTTNYVATCDAGEVVSLTAPAAATVAGTSYSFVRWTLDGTPQPDGQRTIQITMTADRTAAAGYAASAIPGGYVASWRFENNVLDDTGVNNGTQHGGSFVAGRIGQALALSRAGQNYVGFGNNPSLNFGTALSFSISLWIRRNTGAWTQEEDAIAKHSNSWQGWRVGFVSYGGRPRIYFGAGDTSSGRYAYGAYADDIQWRHVVAILDRSANNITIWGNAMLLGTTAIPAGFNVNPATANVEVGRRNSVLLRYLDGTVDQIRIYPRVLTPAEIQALFNEGGAAGDAVPLDAGPLLDGDANGDCSVDIRDIILIRNHLGQDINASFDPRTDANRDGRTDILDLLYARNRLGTRCE